MRVARFIGRLGIVSLPAVEVGLDLDQRVVRRHVAKLEAAGWLGRMPWVWGQGSVAWLTALGIERAGLGGVRPVKSPPAPTTIAHAVLVEWSAARAERRGRTWKSARELVLDGERWEVPTRCERGYTTQLPDLAVRLTPAGPPWAVVAESGGRREDRQKLMLEGWRDAVHGGRYAGVRYDCASASVASWIRRLAKKVWLTAPDFSVIVQTTAEEIATLARADAEGEGRAAGRSLRLGHEQDHVAIRRLLRLARLSIRRANSLDKNNPVIVIRAASLLAHLKRCRSDGRSPRGRLQRSPRRMYPSVGCR